LTRVTLIDGQTAGVSGDMLLAALIDAGGEVEVIRRVLDLIPQHFSRCNSVRLDTTEVKKHGFRSCQVELTISEKPEETEGGELVRATKAIADSSNLSSNAKAFANGSVRVLTEVEGKLHGAKTSDVHLHEAGSTDTLADVFGVAAACDSMGIFDGNVYSLPIAVGGGSITFSHGTVSVPAPAVLEIVRRYSIPIIGGPVLEELTTPTGISMLTNLAGTFLERYPPMIPEKVGYGAGKRDLAFGPNVLRVVMGRTIEKSFNSDVIQVVETNLDDVSGEIVGNALRLILDAGAKDAWVSSAQFKKGRPGYTLHAICQPSDLERISEVIIKETGTLGVRYQQWGRYVLQRDIVIIKVAFGERKFDVRVKVARDRSGKLLGIKPEFDDVESIARSLSRPAREVSALVLQEARKILE